MRSLNCAFWDSLGRFFFVVTGTTPWTHSLVALCDHQLVFSSLVIVNWSKKNYLLHMHCAARYTYLLFAPFIRATFWCKLFVWELCKTEADETWRFCEWRLSELREWCDEALPKCCEVGIDNGCDRDKPGIDNDGIRSIILLNWNEKCIDFYYIRLVLFIITLEDVMLGIHKLACLQKQDANLCINFKRTKLCGN